MEWVLYYPAATAIKLLQALPLRWVATLGRGCGALAYWLDWRHRQVAIRNLARCFHTAKSAAEIRGLARENFRRLGENYLSAIKTAAMTWPELQPHVEFVGIESVPELSSGRRGPNIIAAIGHFGNFELYARFGELAPGYRCATTYRALRQPSLNRLLQSLRGRSGCEFFERRTEAGALKKALSDGNLFLGLLADQHAGERGVAVQFFGQVCSASAAPAILALRYDCVLYTGICYRAGLARWRIEAGDRIPTRQNGQPRTIESITADVQHAFEQAVRRDPANWFWVHNRWKPFRSRSGHAPLALPSSDHESGDLALPNS